MRKAILLGVVVAALITVGTAVALAQQPSQGGPQPNDQSFGHMHEWMTDRQGDVPEWMTGNWNDMQEWMTENWDDMQEWMSDNRTGMPMYGGFSDGSLNPSGEAVPGWCHGSGSRI